LDISNVILVESLDKSSESHVACETWFCDFAPEGSEPREERLIGQEFGSDKLLKPCRESKDKLLEKTFHGRAYDSSRTEASQIDASLLGFGYTAMAQECIENKVPRRPADIATCWRLGKISKSDNSSA
jgi:hypothetical protein